MAELFKNLINGEWKDSIGGQTFENRNPDYWRVDIRFSLKRNYTKATGTIAIDIQNATNHKNIGGQYYDSKTGEIKYWYQMPIIPVLSYRLEF